MFHFFGFDSASFFSFPDFWHAFLIFLATYFGNRHANNSNQ